MLTNAKTRRRVRTGMRTVPTVQLAFRAGYSRTVWKCEAGVRPGRIEACERAEALRRGFLLRQAMQRSESPHQVDRVDPHHMPVRHHRGERIEREAVARV